MRKGSLSAEVKTTLATGGTLLGVIVALAVFAQNEHQAIREDVRHFAARVDQRLAGMDQRLDGMDRRLDGVESRLAGLDQRVGALEARFTGFERRLLTLEGQMGRVLGALGISAHDAAAGTAGSAAPPERAATGEGWSAMPVPGTDHVLLSSPARPPAPGWTTPGWTAGN